MIAMTSAFTRFTGPTVPRKVDTIERKIAQVDGIEVDMIEVRLEFYIEFKLSSGINEFRS